MGDVAQNDGESGHQTRHFHVLNAINDALKRVYGAAVKREPTSYRDYSDHRPDITLALSDFFAMDVKMFDPLGSTEGDVQLRAGHVAFGGTEEEARRIVHGVPERGCATQGACFNRRTGQGHVAAHAGDYARAKRSGVEPVCLLVETFGGMGPELRKVLEAAVEYRLNKLTSSEYDETTWAARNYRTFVKQRISVAIHLAAAQEIAHALDISVATDPRREA